MKELEAFKNFLKEEENLTENNPQSTEYKFYELKSSEDGRSYNTIARIDASVGYNKAREIADKLTDGQFSKYEGGFYDMEDKISSIEIYK